MSQLYTLPLDQLPDPLPIEPLRKPFDVTITPPGSKSITCRAYVLAALAQGESKIIRPLRADDPDHLLNALCTLGAEARWVKSDTHDGEDVYIKGVGGRFPRGGNLYMGDGGAPTRFMIAAACLAAEPVTIDASPRMRERPIAEGVEMLRQLGALIEYVEEEASLPVRVFPSERFHGGRVEVGEMHTSQFVSALMLVASRLAEGVTLVFHSEQPTSESYIWITADLMGEWGIDVQRPRKRLLGRCNLAIKGQVIKPYDYWTEADASSAMHWAAAACVLTGSRMLVRGIAPDSKQPDVGLLDALDDLGMIVAGDESGIEIEGTGGLRRKDRERDRFDFALMPDAAMPFSVCAATQPYPIMLTGLRTLRVKETDRIAALANELRKVGCTVTTGEDWIEITPPTTISAHPMDAASDDRSEEDGGRSTRHARAESPIIIETYNDHRMAMSFAILGLNPPNGRPLAIRNPKCVAKSYPTFWKDFAKLYQ